MPSNAIQTKKSFLHNSLKLKMIYLPEKILRSEEVIEIENE